jgi:hypothetical protein
MPRAVVYQEATALFGERLNPPKPPRYEPFLLVLLAVLIAAVLTLGYFGFMYLVESADQPM